MYIRVEVYTYECRSVHVPCTSHHITSSIPVCMHVHVLDLPCTSQYLVTALAIPYIPSHHFSHRLFFFPSPPWMIFVLPNSDDFCIHGYSPSPLPLSLPDDFCIPPLSLSLPPSLPVSLPNDFCIPPLPTPSLLRSAFTCWSLGSKDRGSQHHRRVKRNWQEWNALAGMEGGIRGILHRGRAWVARR